MNALIMGGYYGMVLGVSAAGINIVTRTLTGTGWISWTLGTAGMNGGV